MPDVEMFTFRATEGGLQGFGASTLKVAVFDATVIDNDNPAITVIGDLTGEITGGTYARTGLTGVSWDTSGAVPGLRADNVTIEGIDTAEAAHIVVYEDATDAVVSGLRFTPVAITGDLPVQWPGGYIATVEKGGEIPDPTVGDAGKVITVGDDGSYELAEPSGGGSSGEILDFEPVLLNGWGSPVDLNGGYTYGRYQMVTESLCWFEAWVDINAGGTPATGTGPFIFLLPKPVKQEPPIGGRPVLRTVGDVVAVRGTPTSNTGKCRGAVTGGDLSTAFGAPPGTVAPQACIFDNVTSDIDEEAQSFGWTTPPSGDGFPFDWCVDATFLKFTGTYEIEPD